MTKAEALQRIADAAQNAANAGEAGIRPRHLRQLMGACLALWQAFYDPSSP